MVAAPEEALVVENGANRLAGPRAILEIYAALLVDEYLYSPSAVGHDDGDLDHVIAEVRQYRQNDAFKALQLLGSSQSVPPGVKKLQEWALPTHVKITTG